jgi:mannose-6-phosphate isomerase-like protein (cupin superfamily)
MTTPGQNRSKKEDPMQPRITSLDQAASIKPFGIDMKLMLGSKDTGGTFSAVMAEVKPGEGPPPHMHHDREEYFYVLDGTYKFSLNGNETIIGPNTLVFVPRGTVHAFSNIASTPSRVLEWTIPGNNGDYFQAVDKMQTEGGFDPAKLAVINKEFATEFVG